jgi:hypothetical protein
MTGKERDYRRGEVTLLVLAVPVLSACVMVGAALLAFAEPMFAVALGAMGLLLTFVILRE